MGALRFTSLSGICCVTYLVLIILYEYFNLCHKDDDCFWQKSSGLTWEDMAVSDWEKCHARRSHFCLRIHLSPKCSSSLS
eukprot:UN02787